MFIKTASATTLAVLVAGCTTVELPIAPIDQRPASYPDPAPSLAPSVSDIGPGKEVDNGVVVHAVTTVQPTVRRLELPPVRAAAMTPSTPVLPSTKGVSSASRSTGDMPSAGSSPLNAASGQSSGASSTPNSAVADGVMVMKPKAVPDESVSPNKPVAVEATPEGFAVPRSTATPRKPVQ